jgi:hypothetical protein
MLGLERFLTSGDVGGVFGDEVSADGDRDVFRRVVDNDKDRLLIREGDCGVVGPLRPLGLRESVVTIFRGLGAAAEAPCLACLSPLSMKEFPRFRRALLLSC